MDKAKELYRYLCEYVTEHGYPPTIREMCAEFSWQSTNSPRTHLIELEKAGLVTRGKRIARGLRVHRGEGFDFPKQKSR